MKFFYASGGFSFFKRKFFLTNMNTQVLYIDSKNRIQGTFNNFIINVPPGIVSPKKYAVGDISIPRSYYNINEYTQQFIFSDSVTQHVLLIPQGNYTISDYLTLLVNEMNLVSADLHTANISTSTGKVTFTTNGVSMSVDFTNNYILGLMLGFNQEEYIGTSIESPNCVSFGYTRNVYIAISQTDSLSYYLNQPDTLIINSLAVNADYGNLINKPQEYHVKYALKGDRLFNTFNVRLLDDYGNLLPVCSDWSINLTFFL